MCVYGIEDKGLTMVPSEEQTLADIRDLLLMMELRNYPVTDNDEKTKLETFRRELFSSLMETRKIQGLNYIKL